MTPDELLNGPRFRRAVVSIQRRAEKELDWKRVADVFVRSDLLDRVQARATQLILGRRGTGKTHLIRVFHEEAVCQGDMAVYLDCTHLGSGYTGLKLAPRIIAQKYFIALLNDLGTELFDQAVRMELPEGERQQAIIGRLSEGLMPQLRFPTLEDQGPDFNYRQIVDLFSQVVELFKARTLFIILDEWAQIPRDAQAYFAEYVKRAIACVPTVALKILAVNYQCAFSFHENDNLIGLERGADITDTIDLDRYLVYDEKSDFVKLFFAQLLYNHLGVELDWPLDIAPEEKRKWIVGKLFTQERAFIELVRAAEGNARDFLCIFSKAFFDEYRRASNSNSISIPNVVAAATTWFDQEKAANVLAEPEARETLLHIMEKVLKGYKSRTFLVESSKAEHPRLLRLLNERVLHRLNETYSHPDRPGVRYDIFTVDYGTYARFRDTVNQVEDHVFLDRDKRGQLNSAEQSLWVPVDDNRSIRRIVFDPLKLDAQQWLPGMSP